MEKEMEVLISQEQLAKKVRQLGQVISSDYRGKTLLLIGVLKGAVVFLSDLMRHLTVPVEIDFMAVSSYGFSTSSSGVVRILKDLEQSIEQKDILIVEDIIDTGLTLSYLCKILRSRRPKSLRVVALLDKPERREVDIEPDYWGFRIPDRFVVGYGLDYKERYRNLASIFILPQS